MPQFLCKLKEAYEKRLQRFVGGGNYVWMSSTWGVRKISWRESNQDSISLKADKSDRQKTEVKFPSVEWTEAFSEQNILMTLIRLTQQVLNVNVRLSC